MPRLTSSRSSCSAWRSVGCSPCPVLASSSCTGRRRAQPRLRSDRSDGRPDHVVAARSDLGPEWLAYLACVAFGGVVTLVYGVVFGPPFAAGTRW